MNSLTTPTLPAGIRSRYIANGNGLNMHLLEAGFETDDRPLVLLLHGFPELAYSWRKVMLPIAAAGFHVIAPDQRGYGRTTGWDDDYDGDLHAFNIPNLVIDLLGLINALGYPQVTAVIGHDFGSPVASYCALIRPDVFRSVVMMSAPFAGPLAKPVDAPQVDMEAALAALPQPRKHYQWYYSTRQANTDMWRCPQGVHDFLRAYFHVKSADWKANKPFPLSAWSASELAKLPTYYIMNKAEDMAQTAAATMPSAAEIAACEWLTEAELNVYSEEYRRTGFQGSLQWYRCATAAQYNGALQLFNGLTIDVPSLFIAGQNDWGIYQKPGAIDAMQNHSCTNMIGCHLLADSGHWVQQEQPEQVSNLLLEFLSTSENQR